MENDDDGDDDYIGATNYRTKSESKKTKNYVENGKICLNEVGNYRAENDCDVENEGHTGKNSGHFEKQLNYIGKNFNYFEKKGNCCEKEDKYSVETRHHPKAYLGLETTSHNSPTHELNGEDNGSIVKRKILQNIKNKINKIKNRNNENKFTFKSIYSRVHPLKRGRMEESSCVDVRKDFEETLNRNIINLDMIINNNIDNTGNYMFGCNGDVCYAANHGGGGSGGGIRTKGICCGESIKGVEKLQNINNNVINKKNDKNKNFNSNHDNICGSGCNLYKPVENNGQCCCDVVGCEGAFGGSGSGVRCTENTDNVNKNDFLIFRKPFFNLKKKNNANKSKKYAENDEKFSFKALKKQSQTSQHIDKKNKSLGPKD